MSFPFSEKIGRAQIRKARNIFPFWGCREKRGGGGAFVERTIQFRATTRSARAPLASSRIFDKVSSSEVIKILQFCRKRNRSTQSVGGAEGGPPPSPPFFFPNPRTPPPRGGRVFFSAQEAT